MTESARHAEAERYGVVGVTDQSQGARRAKLCQGPSLSRNFFASVAAPGETCVLRMRTVKFAKVFASTFVRQND
jgi:hypothetical protein